MFTVHWGLAAAQVGKDPAHSLRVATACHRHALWAPGNQAQRTCAVTLAPSSGRHFVRSRSKSVELCIELGYLPAFQSGDVLRPAIWQQAGIGRQWQQRHLPWMMMDDGDANNGDAASDDLLFLAGASYSDALATRHIAWHCGTVSFAAWVALSPRTHPLRSLCFGE